MNHKHIIILTIALSLTSFLITISLLTIFFFYKKKSSTPISKPTQKSHDMKTHYHNSLSCVEEFIIGFYGGEKLTIQDILEAPGEVIGKSCYGTLYKAMFFMDNAVMEPMLLRFLRPASTLIEVKEVVKVVELLGSVRYSNLVPIRAFYAGPRGEKLLVFPFYHGATLAQFIRDGKEESRKWATIYKISTGIAKAMNHLHNGTHNQIIHGNLKSKNILLEPNQEPYISDFGLHLLLNPTSAQEMLDSLAIQGYKAPELIKMKDASKETDIYSFGVILLELVTGKEPINKTPLCDEDSYLPNCVRNAILDYRIRDLLEMNPSLNDVKEECVLKFFQLAMACCSPSPSLRPDTKQILQKLNEIGK